MADTVIKGVYATKSALDTAHAADAAAGDQYIVGSKCPYDLYTFKTSAFSKTGTVDFTPTGYVQPIANLYTSQWESANGNIMKVRKGWHIGKIELYKPEQ